MKIASLTWFASLALALALPSNAALVRPSQVEASMLVTGTVHIAPNGNVTSYSLDKAAKLPDGVKKVVAKTVPSWTFKPILVEGKRMAGVSRMYLRLVAKPLSDDKYAVSIRGARFGKPGSRHGVAYGNEHRPHPNYPMVARRDYMGGSVFLVARVNRQGKVAKVAVEQVNLDRFSTPTEMKRCRQAFTRASERAVKDWTFRPPTKGPKVAADHWDVRIPIAFRLARFGTHRARASTYGKWQVYAPGPHTKVAWLDDDQGPAGSADAMPNGALATVGQSRHLLTPLSGG